MVSLDGPWTRTAQPSLEGLEKIALALHVKLDDLVFEPGERMPLDEQLRPQFEAIAQMTREDKKVVQAVLDGLIVKHRTKQLMSELRT